MRIRCLSLIGCVVAAASGLAHAQPLEDRITALLQQMTTEEKILQLHAEGGFNTADNQRLGIPGFIMADGPHGVRDGLATSFPVGIGMAAMWDTAMARLIGVAMGKEFAGKGKHQALGPAVDIDRDPRNGRSPETGGEDPYLCAQITTAVVRGIQSTPTIATVKHYTANHRENGRTTNNILASRRILHEDAGLPFRTAVQMGGALSVMNAYNLVNGDKCAESRELLTTMLRTRWGFPYYVVSDWGSIWNSQKAISAGCDICMGSDNYRNDLPGLVAAGQVSGALLDSAVRRVLRTKLVAGMLDYRPSGNPDDVNSPAHQALCLEAGRKSLVLLKNEENILPLSTELARGVALIGPHAATLVVDGSGSAYVTPFYTITPRQGIESIIGASRVTYARGCDINSADTSGFGAALQAAANADVVIFCGGLDGGQEGEGFDRVGGSTTLPGRQQDLINRLAAANPKLVAVIFSGGVCTLERCIGNIEGLIYAFYPGQEAGRAIAEVLFGRVNPGGRLPVTIPRNVTQLPPWNDNLNDDYGCGYRWFDATGNAPEFAFGSGLSYTTFSYGALDVAPSSVAPGEPVQVSATVTNSGLVAGDEVIQLYLSYASPPVPMPTKALKGFRRVTLAPGESRRITFTLTAEELYFFNESTSQYEVPTGNIVVRLGRSSDTLPLTGVFTVRQSQGRPDLLITDIRTVPPYPVPGEQVLFLAAVKNQGSAATQAGVPLNVAFTLGGTLVSSVTGYSSSIPPGGMALLCGDSGPGGIATWTAAGAGSYALAAVADPGNTVDECSEGNNTASHTLAVYDAPPPNLALRKHVSVTSIEGPGYEGKYAVDGNRGTRWSSAFSDPQVLVIDLGYNYRVDMIDLYWEAAYATEYAIRIADDGGAWREVETITNGDGGVDRVQVGADARRVMMVGTRRATQYGYSLFEVEVFGGPATDRPDDSTPVPSRFALYDAYPNPFNPATNLRYDLPERATVQVSVHSVLGQELLTVIQSEQEAGRHSVVIDGSGLATGVYLCRFRAVSEGGIVHSGVRRIMLVK